MYIMHLCAAACTIEPLVQIDIFLQPHSLPVCGLRLHLWLCVVAGPQYSPLIVAGIVSIGITAAAILLNAEVEQGEQALGPITLPRIKSLNLSASAVPLAQAAALALALLGVFAGAYLP